MNVGTKVTLNVIPRDVFEAGITKETIGTIDRIHDPAKTHLGGEANGSAKLPYHVSFDIDPQGFWFRWTELTAVES